MGMKLEILPPPQPEVVVRIQMSMTDAVALRRYLGRTSINDMRSILTDGDKVHVTTVADMCDRLYSVLQPCR